jgi:hypothetical protein
METWFNNRLTIVGPAKHLKRFEQQANWKQKLNAKCVELYEHSARRHVWWFETSKPVTARLTALSVEFPKLVLLLDSECENRREKSMSKIASRRLEHCTFSY